MAMDGPSEVMPPSNSNETPHPEAVAIPLTVMTALGITADTSNKYVPQPSKDMILADELSMQQDFRCRVRRYADKIKLREREQDDDEIIPPPAVPFVPLATRRSLADITNTNQPPTNRRAEAMIRRSDDGDDRDFWIEPPDHDLDELLPRPQQKMNTGLYDKLRPRTEKPSDHIQSEALLNDFATISGSQVRHKILHKDSRDISEFDINLTKAFKALGKENDWVLAESDKTNRWVPTQVVDYINDMNVHLVEKCVEIKHKVLTETFEEAMKILKKFEHLMSDGEAEFITSWIATRRVPTPRLLIKDHKDKGENGRYTTRFLCPATNFTQCFAKISYMAIKNIFEANGIKTMSKTINNSHHLKIDLEKLDLKEDNCTISSLDIVNMYPSIKAKLTRKAIMHYAVDNVSDDDMDITTAALEMQSFSMGNTLLTFRDKYYRYGQCEDVLDRTLTIGGYDSAWLADLVASYIFELAADHFEETSFFGIYRDDGIQAHRGNRPAEEMMDWLHTFQEKVNTIVGDTSIQFTMEVWKPGEESRTLVPKKLEVVGTKTFPYLDVNLKFDENHDLCFGVYTKPGFQSKYLNVNSCHPSNCKKAITKGVSIRLAGLTTRKAQNENESLSHHYPTFHANLKKAGHLRGDDHKLPKLSTILDSRDKERAEADMARADWKKDAKRTIFLIKKHDGNWRTPLHKTIQKLRLKYDLKWMRVRMIYKRHMNVKEMLLGDITKKIMRGIDDAEYLKKIRRGKCNCRSTHKPNGECLYKEECETRAVIYKISCKCCDSFYIGKTSRSLKSRCQEHYQGLGKFFNMKKRFLTQLEEEANPPLPTPNSNNSSSSSSVSTRSQTRTRLNTPHPPQHSSQLTTTPGSTGMSYLLTLMSNSVLRRQAALTAQAQTPLQIQPSIPEMYNPGECASDLSDDASGAHPSNLFHNPTHDPSNQESNNQQDDDSSHSTASHQSNTTTNAFGRAFGPLVANLDLDQLEKDRATLLQPWLESDYSKIECSNITRHMWAHCKDMQFKTKDELYTWVRKNWEVDIIHKMPITSALKSAGTRFCNLCMKERVAIFNAMHNKQTSKNLINSRTELYGKCSCKTRFLRLSAVGNEGADEATS